VSSTYRAICMSHDPASEIDLDGIHHGNVNLLDTALLLVTAAVRKQHPGCELLIGRYSYSLVEVSCPPSRSDKRTCPVFHSEPNSVSLDWLRLLYHARQVPATKPLSEALASFDRTCWGPRRVERLMRLVGDEYASNLKPLVSPVVGMPAAVAGGDGRFLGCFHGGCAAEMTMVVPAQFPDKPCGVASFGADVYDRASLPDGSGVWHYQVRVAS